MTILSSTGAFDFTNGWTGTVPVNGGTGYLSATLEVLNSAGLKQIRFGWRPIVKNDANPPQQIETRWLPVFIDLKGISTGEGHFAELPDYGYLYNLTSADLESNTNYYLYFVHPETPAAVPLLRDEGNHHDGIEIRVYASKDVGLSAFTFRLNVLASVEA